MDEELKKELLEGKNTMNLKIINISAVTLDDSWFQLVYNCLESGRPFKIDKGSFAGSTRLELDFVLIHIKQPYVRNQVTGWPLIPIMPEGVDIPAPVTEKYLADYAPYLLEGDIKPNESYTYGQRLNAYLIPPEDNWLSQVEEIIQIYKEYGPRNNQMVLQVAEPSDLRLDDPPCLRHIDTRIQDNRLHFYPYFRSWDLWNGYPANLAAISMLQEYMADHIGVDQGEMICTSKGLHIYDYAVEFAEMRAMIKASNWFTK